MTPYEEYEQKKKLQERELKRQSREKRILEKMKARERKRIVRERESSLTAEPTMTQQECRELARISFKILDVDKAKKEGEERRKMDFANNSIVNLLHKPK
jgi:hypothetical protein